MIKISLFTPTHNTKFLNDLYLSIKNQDFYEWIIVYNNGATPIDFQDERIKSFILDFAPEWVGPLKAYACEQATGDVLLEMDHDDMLMPNAIEEVKEAFKDREIGFVYSNTIHCNSDYTKVQRFNEIFGWKYREINFNGHVLDEHISFDPDPNSISRIWFAPNHLRAFRKTTYDSIGGYNKKMRILDDLDLMCRLYQITKFKHINKGLYVYRIHGENTWLKYNEEIQNNVYRIHDQYIESLALRWAELNNLRKLDLGGGIDGDSRYETVDLKNASINSDLNDRWCFDDNSVGVIRACDIFEHLKDNLHTMKELYRVLAPNGYAIIQVPSTDGRGAFQDPTHVSFWNENSFYYYTDASFGKYIYNPVRFQAIRLYTTQKNVLGVCWTVAHLVKVVDGYRYPGLVLI